MINEAQLERFIEDDHEIMTWLPIEKVDKYGKKKFDRILLLTSHQILIIHDGVTDLEVKSNLEIKTLEYIVRPVRLEGQICYEYLLCFSNKNASCMHLVMLSNPKEFIDLLKLRWVKFNPKKTLKVFAVSQNLTEYHTGNNAGNKYTFENKPDDQFRVAKEEILSNEEYMRKQSLQP